MKEIFISFDFENDRSYKYTFNMWNGNKNIKFNFNDYTPKEIQSYSIPVIKGVITKKIAMADYIIVIVGKEANKLHPDSKAIGYRNWQNFEVAKAKELNKRIVAVQLNSVYQYPEELLNTNAIRVYKFELEAILKAIGG